MTYISFLEDHNVILHAKKTFYCFFQRNICSIIFVLQEILINILIKVYIKWITRGVGSILTITFEEDHTMMLHSKYACFRHYSFWGNSLGPFLSYYSCKLSGPEGNLLKNHYINIFCTGLLDNITCQLSKVWTLKSLMYYPM
jgi:hypothetical protein